jgi:hypothetical protein
MKNLLLLTVFIVFFSSSAHAELSLSLEAGPAWQTRNDVRIPPDTGTPFSISDIASGPFLRGRLYASFGWNERHEMRALVAPLSITASTTFAQNVDFAGQTFTTTAPVEANYKFNSYRLTYRYLFYRAEEWQLKVGFTAKIRDAAITLNQGTTSARSSNVGFVPLLNFAAKYQAGEDWYLLFDLDGLAAPQGRAFDGSLQVGWQASPNYDLSIGYRTVEGGAKNSTVSTFAWVHYLVFGATVRF